MERSNLLEYSFLRLEVKVDIVALPHGRYGWRKPTSGGAGAKAGGASGEALSPAAGTSLMAELLQASHDGVPRNPSTTCHLTGHTRFDLLENEADLSPMSTIVRYHCNSFVVVTAWTEKYRL